MAPSADVPSSPYAAHEVWLYQRQGLATALVTQGMVYAQERGAAAIWSMTQRGNVRSLQFHESLGFEQEGHLTLPDGTEMVRFCLATG